MNAKPEPSNPEGNRRRRRKRSSGRAQPSTALPGSVPAPLIPDQADLAAELAPANDSAIGQPKPHAKPHVARPRHTPPPFGDLALSEITLAALEEAGYDEPTPIQKGLIPRAMAGVDVMGQAQTGTGKTAAFAIPILEQIKPRHRRHEPTALVLVPTRELAVQVRDEFRKLSAGRDARTVAVYGGKPIRKQTEEIHHGADVVVGTPGRTIDLMDRGTLVTAQVRIAVLDEADRMLDIGFRPDIEKILRRLPASRQTLLLSATIPPPVARLAERYMRDPESLDFSTKDLAVETIEQFYFTIDPERKFDLLVRLLEREKPAQSIIFCRTKRGTEKIHHRLLRKIQGVAAIHGDLPQSTRDEVMSQFRAGRVRHLVATDVVGRGIDVTRISHIINYDIPQFCDDYIHRVGRTGRMGREGVAYTFVSPEEGNELTRIEVRINRLLKRGEMPGFETFAEPKAVHVEKAPSQPVFGRRVRRVRRAL